MRKGHSEKVETMTPERWQQVNKLFTAAVELEPEERAVFLDRACADDIQLRSEVESLLESDGDKWGLIEKPALEVAAPLLAHERQQLTPGQSFSHYEIVSLIGKGGMGEVYLAADKLLNRKIALKLLPADSTRDKERLRRFQQEAQAASALNHPNILTIHEIGHAEDQRFIATEFVDGETLRQRLAHKPMSLSETLEIAVQIASALAAAHQAGIVHRDIKPENIMLRRDGYVKVLDFGLAKLTEQQEPATKAPAAENVNISSGLVMGTVRYMSPEQARGLKVDPRSDIFSFGVVLYEMLAGRAPFEGEGHELVGAILKKDAPSLANVPDEIQRLINRALQKRKEDRYQTIQELLIDLKRLQENMRISGGVPSAYPPTGESAHSTSQGFAVSTVSTVQVIVSGIKRHKTGAALILAVLAVVGFGLTGELNRFRGRLQAPPKEIKVTRIPNTDRAGKVAISPNGEYIAYTEMNNVGKPSVKSRLWTLEVATNRRVMIAPPANNNYRGLTYSRDGGDIFYVGNDDVLYRIPASGGEPTKVLADVGAFSFSPDGDKVAFWRALNSEETAVMVANMDGSGERVLASRKKPEFIDGPAWSPDGSLIACTTGVNARSGQASVIGLDAATGEERRITDQKWDEFSGRVAWLPDGSGLMVSAPQIWLIPYPPGEARKVTSDPNYDYGDISVTADGKSLVTGQSAWRSSVWMMPNGDPSAAMPITSGEHDSYRWVSCTPDGRILYASLDWSSVGTSRNIWIMDGDGTNPKQLTVNAGMNMQPTASPDGRYIVFSSNRADAGAFNVWRMDIDGSNPVQITSGSGEVQPVCSPDGRWVVYSKGGPNTTPKQKTVWKTSIEGGEPVQLASRPSSGAAISPDGTLIACWYKQDSDSPMKIALIPFEGGPPIRILDAEMSSIVPVHWRPDGKVINYVHTDPFVSNIWNQPVAGGPPQPLTHFTTELIGGLDWSRDGKLFCARRHSVQDVIIISDFR